MAKLFALDSMAILYRNYFAMIRNPMINSKGLNTSGIYGFFSQIVKIIETEKPDYLAVVSDSKEPTFRHKQFPEYKANREKMPDDLVEQLSYLPRLVEALNLPYIIMPGFEADDIIGTLMRICSEKDMEGVMVTSDKDYMQLVTEKNVMFNHKNQKIGIKQVFEKFACRPNQVIDILGLMGDASDNIPGVKGVGEKTAIKLITQFGSIPAVYEAIDQLPKNKLKEKLINDREKALLSRELVTIDINVPIEVDLQDLNLEKTQVSENKALIEILEELEFKSFLKKFKSPSSKSFKSFESIVETEVPVETTQKTLEQKSIAIQTQDEFDKLVDSIVPSEPLALDVIKKGESFINSEIVGLVLSNKSSEAWYLNFEDPTFSDHRQAIFQKLKPFIESPVFPKVVYNWKHLLQLLWHDDIKTGSNIMDVMLAAHLVESDERDYSLEGIAFRQLNYKKQYFVPFKKNKPDDGQTVLESEADFYKAYCESTGQLWRLYDHLLQQLNRTQMINTYQFVEIRLAEVLAILEMGGVNIDVDILKKISDEFTLRLEAISENIFELSGERFNINSIVELQNVLYNKLKVHELCKVKPKKIKLGNKLSTGEETLEKMLEHPLPKVILQYRELNKLKNTYVDQLPTFINTKTGRIHSSFRQTSAATGRLASDKPNLQNIPIRTEEGRRIRGAFVPADADNVLVSADYSQIELRVIAHYSKDPTFMEAYRQNLDIHAITAATIFDVPVTAVTREMRSKAKEVNFGLIYRMGPERLALITNSSRTEAKNFIARYFEKYATIHGLQEQFLTQARNNGFAKTLMGRRRYLPAINSRGLLRRMAEGAAINTPIQGSAAEIIKLAMIAIDQKLSCEKFNTKMILSVHDELVFDTPKEEVSIIVDLVKQEMENVLTLEVPLIAEVGIGENWLEAH
ncbi:MAG: DNA polymerase I [Deltaproteobacteria bacterium]|nr:DNA polymerase I [Deltaproteobacteria bacterium]